MQTHETDPPACVLVSVQLATVTDADHEADVAELSRLCKTLGYDVVATVTQRRSALAHGTVIGEGKLAELAALTGGTGNVQRALPKKDKARLRREAEAGIGDDDIDEGDGGDDEEEAPSTALAKPARKPTIVVVDHEITPSQARNLERATGAEVKDRTGVIVEIFHRHAKSREARLQVEIAQLNYVAPRLRESPGGSTNRQKGKGAGESHVELDRRRIRDRIAELREELEGILRDQATRRALRRDQRRVALVGYTNAGKSSLMRALTGSEVLVADKLFATLDTTVRALHPEVRPRILVSDTVGFIKKLPHDLVASFRSTLDEALEASLLLYVVDASDPTFRSQLAVTRSVLAEIGADAVPSLVLLNKIDEVDRHDPAARAALQAEFPDAILLSAKATADVAALRETLVAFFEEAMVDGELTLPYAKQGLVGEVYENARVVSEDYDATGRRMQVRADPAALARLVSLIAKG